MGRRRKAWLMNGTGRRLVKGRTCPGYYVCFNEYGSGRRAQRSRHFLSLRAARTWVRRYNARSDLGELGEVIPIGIRDAAGEFQNGLGAVAVETARSYATALGLLIGFLGRADLLVSSVTPADIDRFVSKRMGQSTGTTVAKHLRSLNVFFRWALKRSYLAENPVAGATSKPKSLPRERPTVTEAQLARLVECADTTSRKLAIGLAYHTGADRGTIERLTAEMVDLENGTIAFVRQKTGRANVVQLPDAMLPWLRQLCDQASPGTPVLTGLTHQHSRKDWWLRVRREAQMPRLLFRDLRAVSVDRLKRLGGASDREALEVTGHSTVTTLRRHYHVPDPTVRDRLRSLPAPGFPPLEAPTTKE